MDFRVRASSFCCERVHILRLKWYGEPMIHDAPLRKSELTRAKIQRSAFELFLKHGLDGTTMRGIAAHAGVATGLLYRYFPSKDAIVMAFYATHTARVAKRVKRSAEQDAPHSPAERFRVALTSELDSLSRSHSRLLLALLQLSLTPSSPAWLFSEETQGFRTHAQESTRWVLEHAHVSGEALDALVSAFWALRMGLLYFAVNDSSPSRRRTRKLIEEVSQLLGPLPLLAPLATPILVKVSRILREAGLTLA